jgi:hypothetical protein
VTHWAETPKGSLAGMLGHPPLEDTIRDDPFVYRKNDLLGLCSDIKEFWGVVFRFTAYLKLSGNSLAEQQFLNLYSAPQIQRALSRLWGLAKYSPNSSTTADLKAEADTEIDVSLDHSPHNSGHRTVDLSLKLLQYQVLVPSGM